MAELRQELHALEHQFGHGGSSSQSPVYLASDAPTSFGSYARAVLVGRAALTKYFDPALFADPGMDILLFLFAEGEERRQATTSACCAAARVPRTTALRWIRLLERQGLVIASDADQDGRMTLLQLSDSARQSLDQWLQEVSVIPLRRWPDRSSQDNAAFRSPD